MVIDLLFYTYIESLSIRCSRTWSVNTRALSRTHEYTHGHGRRSGGGHRAKYALRNFWSPCYKTTTTRWKGNASLVCMRARAHIHRVCFLTVHLRRQLRGRTLRVCAHLSLLVERGAHVHVVAPSVFAPARTYNNNMAGASEALLEREPTHTHTHTCTHARTRNSACEQARVSECGQQEPRLYTHTHIYVG
jgi:hypothetical protein